MASFEKFRLLESVMGSKSRSRKSNSKKRKFHGNRHTKFINAQSQRQGATAYSPVQDHEDPDSERGDTRKVTPGPGPTASTSNSLETSSVTAQISASSKKLTVRLYKGS